jgi:hypothetical protein
MVYWLLAMVLVVGHPFHVRVRVRVGIVPIRSREVAHSTKYFVLGQREIFYFVRNFGLII